MALNTGKLAGKTVFISGASRGIGKAIALKLAKDGAKIVIAAKTAEPHPKLPGTIYTAAAEIEKAGGECLPCVVDIRDEKAVNTAVENAVKKFGGIDIVVNNASAISLTGTLDTSMKRYDLMNDVNTRGSFLCSKACLPYLKVSKNPHILNISPPLVMEPKWFKNHVAYSIAKYGMSMCVLGMSHELKDDHIAVNALWPVSVIATAAAEMLLSEKGQIPGCRTPDIMSDAAYVILSKDSKSATGNFYLDEDVLADVGMTDLSQYDCVPGSPITPDYFLPAHKYKTEEDADRLIKSAKQKPKGDSAGSTTGGGIEPVMQKVEALCNEALVQSVGAVFQFTVTGEDGGEWYLDLKNGSGSVGHGKAADGSNAELIMNTEDFAKMFNGELVAAQAFMTGKLKIKGDMIVAMKLEKLMKQMKSKL